MCAKCPKLNVEIAVPVLSGHQEEIFTLCMVRTGVETSVLNRKFEGTTWVCGNLMHLQIPALNGSHGALANSCFKWIETQ